MSNIEELRKKAGNVNLDEEQIERLHEIYDELKEIGISGTWGTYLTARTEEEQDFLLKLEEHFMKIEQKKLINRPFVR